VVLIKVQIFWKLKQCRLVNVGVMVSTVGVIQMTVFCILAMRWAEYVARTTNSRGAYRVLVRKPEEKRPLGRPRCSWEGRGLG
jgi:hypothetical protein